MSSILTDEARAAYDIFDKVSDPLARALLYQCLFHIDIFKMASVRLHEAMEELRFRDFARKHTSHMTEGVFGGAMHTAHLETAKQKIIGYLGIVTSSGHKCLRAMNNARKRDGDSSWKQSKRQLTKLEDEYRLARNACQHLDESINRGETTTLEDFSFSKHSILRFARKKKSGKETRHFDFSEESLQKVGDLWDLTLETIRAR